MKAWCDPLRLLDNGWHVLPLRPGSKLPAIAGWNRLAMVPPTEEQVARWAHAFPASGWGAACGFCCIGVDNDTDTTEASRLFEAVRLTTLGETPAVRIGKPGRSVTLYRPADTIRYVGLLSAGGEVQALNADMMTGRQVAVFGPHPKAAAGRYVWPVEDLHALTPWDLPPVTAAGIAAFADALNLAFVSAGLARPGALAEGRSGSLDRAAARMVRRAGRAGPDAALAAARRCLDAAALSQRAGAKVARHPLGLAVAVEAVNAGCDPEEVDARLGVVWSALLDHAERRSRRGELGAMARWAAKGRRP